MELQTAIEERFGQMPNNINYVQDDIVFTTEDGRLFMLKYYPGPPGRGLFSLAAMHHLEINRFSNVPYAVDAAPFIFENKIYYLSNCVNGREGNVENISDLRHSAIMLAHMHKAAEGFTLQKAIRYMEEFNASIEDGSKEADVSKFVRMELGNLPELYIHRSQELKRYKKVAKKHNNHFDYEYISIADYYCEKAEKLCYDIEKSGYNELVTFYNFRGTLCHKEFAPHNVIFTEKNTTASGVVEFGSCSIDLPVLDLANLIKRRMRKCGWIPQTANMIINSYIKYRNLTQADINILKIILDYPQKLWRIVNVYYNSRKTWCEKSCLKKLEEIKNEKDGIEAVLKSI